MNENDYDNDGNNIVPCPICLNVYCLSKQGGKCPEEDAFVKAHTDPYEAQGSNLRVHHPTQPKTQVEKWEEEVKENQRIITECACGGECPKKGTDNCRDRISKIYQLYELIAQATQPIHPRYATGTFADDLHKNVSKMWEKKLTESVLEVSLLDKIKKLLQ